MGKINITKKNMNRTIFVFLLICISKTVLTDGFGTYDFDEECQEISTNGKYCTKWKLIAKTGACFSINSYLIVEGYGQKKINDIKNGEKVLSIDPKTQEPYYADFVDYLHFFENAETLFNKITLDNGQDIEVTDNHHVYIKDTGYTFAGNVKIGDSMLFLTMNDKNFMEKQGEFRKVIKIEKVKRNEVY